MNLIELYDSLSFPDGGNENTLNAIPIPEHSSFRIAINVEGYPILLLSVVNTVKGSLLKNFRLKYLQLEHNIECKIFENGKVSSEAFTVITFLSIERTLQEYFLRISETLIKSLNSKPTPEQVLASLNKFVEVFRCLSDTPTSSVHGLWTELFLIESCSNPKMLLNYWHNYPEEKFDFNSGVEKIEVKSSSNFKRIHTFSSEQLNPPLGSRVLIASIFVRQHINGKSILHLIESITNKIQRDIDLTEKLNKIIFKTLGNTLEQSIKIKFDYDIAKDSLQFYNHETVSKIDKINIPQEVNEVKFNSDLSNAPQCILSSMPNKQALFNSI